MRSSVVGWGAACVVVLGGCMYDWDGLRYQPGIVSDATAESRDMAPSDTRADVTGVDRTSADVQVSIDTPVDTAPELPSMDVRDAGSSAHDVVVGDVLDVARDVAPETGVDVAPDTPAACTPVGMHCPCAPGNPGGYCRPGEACTGGRCVSGTLAGALVITEIMNDPNALLDEVGEWVEVHNPGGTPLDLRGLRLRNARSQSATLEMGATPVVVAPGGYALFARSRMVPGVMPHWVYGEGLASNVLTFSNSTSGDSVILDLGSMATEIDRVTYSEAAMWPYASGRAKSLRPTAISAMDNDIPSNWCNAPTQWAGAGDYGSPGQANPPCP